MNVIETTRATPFFQKVIEKLHKWFPPQAEQVDKGANTIFLFHKPQVTHKEVRLGGRLFGSKDESEHDCIKPQE